MRDVEPASETVSAKGCGFNSHSMKYFHFLALVTVSTKSLQNSAVTRFPGSRLPYGIQ